MLYVLLTTVCSSSVINIIPTYVLTGHVGGWVRVKLYQVHELANPFDLRILQWAQTFIDTVCGPPFPTHHFMNLTTDSDSWTPETYRKVSLDFSKSAWKPESLHYVHYVHYVHYGHYAHPPLKIPERYLCLETQISPLCPLCPLCPLWPLWPLCPPPSKNPRELPVPQRVRSAECKGKQRRS